MPIEDIQPALERIRAKAAQYSQFYAYYAGDHLLNFSSEKFKNKFGKRLQSLKENLCKTVVGAPASRLELIGFQTDAADIEDDAWAIWKGSNMPRIAGKVHREALKTGDAYVIVWKDKNDRVRFYPQMAANMTVWKDGETGEILKAAKAWEENFLLDGKAVKKQFVTLYYPDAIERYESKPVATDALSSVKNMMDTASLTGANFNLRPDGLVKNPFARVPVFHFSFAEEMQDFGTSLLADVIPLQDGLNKSLSDIMVAQEDNARRQRYIAGMQVEIDEETGKKINPFKPDDDFFISEESEAKFGEFSDVNVEQMLKVKQEFIRDIALVSGIPPSYFNLEQTGQAISGEALRKIEARFTSLIEDAQRSFGEGWAGAVSFALEMAGKKGLDIEVQWTDASPVSESETLDNAMKKINLGWSVEQVQRDYGLSDSQIEMMKTENSARNAEKVEAAAKFFDGGGGSLISE